MDSEPLLDNNKQQDDIIRLDIQPSGGDAVSNKPDYLIFLIPGNPGMLKFYAQFFSTLKTLLQNSSELRETRITLAGGFLAGFQGSALPFETPCYTIQDQIESVESKIVEISENLAMGRDGRRPKVILIGHSVGAYILMELARRQDGNRMNEGDHAIDIVGGILLFPTIVDIAKSPHGRILSPLLRLRYFAVVISTLAWLLTFVIPRSAFNYIFKNVLGFADYSVQAALEFARLGQGIAQTLILAKEEMENITADKWDDGVWGHPNRQTPKLFFYFGQNDHWVGTRTRDILITTRGSKSAEDSVWKPEMVVDNHAIPHVFVVDKTNSDIVAAKVYEWARDIITAKY